MSSDSSEYSLFPKENVCQLKRSHLGNFKPLHMPAAYLPERCCPIETAQKWFLLEGKDGKMHEFPIQTIQPKVLMERSVPRKQLPRDVELERRRKRYAELKLEDLLAEAKITTEDMQPTIEQYHLLTEVSFPHFLPISFFDDSIHSSLSPQGWMQSAFIDGVQHALPARVYAPYAQSMIEYDWQFAAVKLIDPERNVWSAFLLADECTYELPRIQCVFLAEDPRAYIVRLVAAMKERDRAEALIQMDAIIDCVLLQDLRDERFMPYEPVDNLFRRHLDVVGGVMSGFMCNLRTEIYLVFERLMAYYEFEKFIIDMPKEFPKFNSALIRGALPCAHPPMHSHIERAAVKALQLDLKLVRLNMLRTTLYYVAAGIEAMMNVANECQYVETLSMFVCSFAKPLPLHEFLMAQQQHSSNIATYLKTFWPMKISNGICMVLRALGKGWLDISLGQWSVYQMCKISRFVLQVKLRMQETMQELLEQSITSFTGFLCDPCAQFLELPANYRWPNWDYINTQFPWSKPVFSLVLGINEAEGVHYSTPPDEFETSLTELFKKALEKTSGVRQIDAETMTNLRFAPNLYILTVELIEPMFLRCNALMLRCYNRAVAPMLAYARLYERFIPFYLLSVSEYMRSYEAAKKSSLQVKSDIIEHKRQKQELRDILPGTITIGPFHIHVDPLKQFLIRKHIEIVRKLFEYYVQRMYDINEALLDRCTFVFHKIAERPTSIEHLYEIRDFGLTVPDQVDHLRADIQIMFLEYEMLDSFFYNISDHQFTMKWQTYAWPHQILHRLSTLREEQKIDIEDFRRLHLSECIGFEERLESLNEEIQAFSLQFDVGKVMETAVEVKKTWKIIQELQKLGALLKFRQQLFEEDELSLAFLDSIIDGFTPYRNLWSTCWDFVKLEEATVGNPIINIELDDVCNTIEELRNSLQKSQIVFVEKPEVQSVATTFLQRLDEFVPVIDCIKWLRNEHWIFMHWQELSTRGGMEIKYSAAINFQYLARRGIMGNLDLVSEISEKAESEAEAYRLAQEEEARRLEEERVELMLRKAARKCRMDIM